ncbi:TOBE domain-containing protein [Microcoleus sp. herbarium14]
MHLGREIQTELLLESGQMVTAYVSRDRFDQLKLVREQMVYVKPKHAMTFPAYAI